MPFLPRLWDLFCRVVDNHGDLGVCWRLARELAARGHQVRLWVDDPAALQWMAPGALAGAQPGVRVLRWRQASESSLLAAMPRADAWVEAFGCELPKVFVEAGARATARGTRHPPVWINLEYLSAEAWVARMHGLPSPVQHGPARGWSKWFFYPGFSAATGGLMRERDLASRQAGFDRSVWLQAQGVRWRGERLVSLFCYEPAALASLLRQLRQSAQSTRLLVTAGRTQQAVRQVLDGQPGRCEGGPLAIDWLPYLPQTAFDELLWASDFNFVRGEDSLVRALWAGRPLVWQPYPQEDGAHGVKLEAWLDWLQAPAPLRRFHRAWSGVDTQSLPLFDELKGLDLTCFDAARQALAARDDLATNLLRFTREKALRYPPHRAS